MQQRADDLAAHAFAKAEFADWDFEKRTDLEALDELAEAEPIGRAVKLVNVREQLETVAGRQVIPELRALSEYRGDAECELVAIAPRDQPQDVGGAGGRMQDASQHFDRGALACAVRADKCDDFA